MTKQKISSGTVQHARVPAIRMRGVAFAILTLAVVCLVLTAPVGAADTDIYRVGTEKTYTTWSSAIDAATDSDNDGNITYEIYGKVTIDTYAIKGSASTINIVGKTADAELTVTAGSNANGVVYVSDAKIETVNFINLNLSRPNGDWIGNIAHHNYFFTVWDSDGSTDLIAYNGCTFLNGSGNNQYGKTTYADCTFYNDVYYALWIYGSGSAGVVEVTNCYFEADRGVKVYSEDASATVKTTIEDSEFVIESKPAIVSSIAGELTIENVDADKCGYGLLASEPKDGRTDLVHASVTVDGKEPEFVASVVNSKGGVMYTTSEKFAETEAKPNDPTAPSIVVLPSAKVGDKKYFSLQDAIIAATPSGTVEILADVTVDEWVMFSETLSIGNGDIITLNINGLTINGNNHNLTINSIESAGNGNRLFYDAEMLNINDLTIKYAEGVSGGIGLQSGTLNKVVFEGGVYGVLPQSGKVIIQECTFKTTGTSIYFEEERDGLTVTGCTFENEDNANVILLRGDVTFTDNTILSGRTVNVVSGSPTVSGNDFGDVRFKVYSDATATITENEINILAFEDAATEVESTFVDNTLSEEANTALKEMGMYTITFVDGDSTLSAITQKSGTTVTAPAYPTKDGFQFVGWDKEIPATMPSEDITLTAVWKEIQPPVSDENAGSVSSGSSKDTGSGNYQYYPRDVPANGIIDFGTSPVVKGMELPAGSSGKVTLNTKPTFTMPENGYYAFEIDAPGYNTDAKINGAISFQIPVADHEAAGYTAEDIILFHGTVAEDETIIWEVLPTNLVKNEDGVAYYKAAINSCSPFYIGFVEDGSVVNTEVVEPITPEQPVTPDEPEVLPPVDEPEIPEGPASPAPLLAVLVALGAAVVLRRK